METGFYRCTDTSVSMSDWIKLNFRAFSTSLFETLTKHDPDAFQYLRRIDVDDCPEEPEDDDLNLPDEPEEEDFPNDPDGEAYDKAYEEWEAKCEEIRDAAIEAWEEARDEWESAQQLMGWPFAWGTGWGARQDSDLQAALIGCNFTVYETESDFEDFGEIIFGVDGAGYSFTEAHWIPLRASLARSLWEKGYCQDDKYEALIEHLCGLLEREGGEPERFREAFLAPKAAA